VPLSSLFLFDWPYLQVIHSSGGSIQVEQRHMLGQRKCMKSLKLNLPAVTELASISEVLVESPFSVQQCCKNNIKGTVSGYS
jgi:hypothetical protein